MNYMNLPPLQFLNDANYEQVKGTGHQVFFKSHLCVSVDNTIIPDWNLPGLSTWRSKYINLMVPSDSARNWLAESNIDFIIETAWADGCAFWITERDNLLVVKLKFELPDTCV